MAFLGAQGTDAFLNAFCGDSRGRVFVAGHDNSRVQINQSNDERHLG